MAYFSSREIAAISVTGATWAVINAFAGPLFWNATHLPILCDILSLLSLIVVVWWTRKFGAAFFTGLVATLINFALGGVIFFLGFTVASISFDLLTKSVGYQNLFSKPHTSKASMIALATVSALSALSALIAGLINGYVFMGMNAIVAILTFAGLNASGGIIGAILGISLVKALEIRKVIPKARN